MEYKKKKRIEGEIKKLKEDYKVNEIWEVIKGRIDGRKDERKIKMLE